MTTRFAHTNIVAADFRKLASFYIGVFDCQPVPPERSLAEEWLARGTGVPRAALVGQHLRLPGHGPQGPTLEIFQYSEDVPRSHPVVANRRGLGHIAFEVENVEAVLHKVAQSGGRVVGETVSADIAGAGRITFVYVADPEDNIIELQSWDRPPTPA